MRALVRRLRQLEGRLVTAVDPGRSETSNLLRERRRRRLEAGGQPREDVPRLRPMPGPYLSCAETLRRCRRERLAAREQVNEGCHQ